MQELDETVSQEDIKWLFCLEPSPAEYKDITCEGKKLLTRTEKALVI